MAAPLSAGVTVSEQERRVALIPVLTRDHFLSNLLRRSLAGRDSLGLSLEGCEPIGPLASKLCTFTPGFRLLLPPPPEIPGVGRSIRSRCHSAVAHQRRDLGAPDLVLAGQAIDVGTGATDPSALTDGGPSTRSRHLPGQEPAARSTAKDQDFKSIRLRDFLSIVDVLPHAPVATQHPRRATGAYIVRTTRNCALPLIIRA